MNPLRSLRKIIYFIIAILVLGTFGYVFLEDYTILEALYQTVITVSTVGFSEVRPFDEAGKAFTIILIVSSIGIFAFGFTRLSQIILDGSLQSYFKFVRVKASIEKLEGHIIICGFGRNGKQAVRKIKAYKEPFVVIDKDEDSINSYRALYPDLLFVLGDSTEDDVLEAAGIRKAKALIAALHNDADNLFVVVSARQINKNLRIVSRANTESAEKKLQAAGADYTVSPNLVGGAHLAHNLMKPDVVSFLEHIDVGGLSASYIEEVSVNLEDKKAAQASRMSELEIRKRTGCNVIGFKSADGEFIVNPSPEMELPPNSKIFALGNDEQIQRLRELFNVKPL